MLYVVCCMLYVVCCRHAIFCTKRVFKALLSITILYNNNCILTLNTNTGEPKARLYQAFSLGSNKTILYYSTLPMQGRFKMEYGLFTIVVRYNYTDYGLQHTQAKFYYSKTLYYIVRITECVIYLAPQHKLKLELKLTWGVENSVVCCEVRLTHAYIDI